MFFQSHFLDLLLFIFLRLFSKMVDFGTPFEIRWGQKSAPGPRKDPAERVRMVFATRCFPILHCTLPHITFLYVLSLGKCICRYPAIADARKGGFWEPRKLKMEPKIDRTTAPFSMIFQLFQKSRKGMKSTTVQHFLRFLAHQNGSKNDLFHLHGRSFLAPFFGHRFA